MEGKFICSSEISTNTIFYYSTLPDIWFVLLVDVVLKIESKLLCLSDFKTFLSFQFVPVLLLRRLLRGCVCVGVKRIKGGGEEDLKKWWGGANCQKLNSLKLQPGWITYYIPSTELKRVCLEKKTKEINSWDRK